MDPKLGVGATLDPRGGDRAASALVAAAGRSRGQEWGPSGGSTRLDGRGSAAASTLAATPPLLASYALGPPEGRRAHGKGMPPRCQIHKTGPRPVRRQTRNAVASRVAP